MKLFSVDKGIRNIYIHIYDTQDIICNKNKVFQFSVEVLNQSHVGLEPITFGYMLQHSPNWDCKSNIISYLYYYRVYILENQKTWRASGITAKGHCQVSETVFGNWKPFKNFLFHLYSSFFLVLFKLLSWLLGHVKKWLD